MSDKQRPVLIVDREKLSGLVSKMIGSEHFTDVAHDGLGAVQKLRESLPKAIIVEVDIPGNGIKLTELVGVNPKFNEIPIILTAANPLPDMIIRAKNAGADSFLAKPFGPSDLKIRLTNLASVRGPAGSRENAVGSSDEAQKPGEEEDESGLSVDIANRVKSIEGLPSFPATHAEILKLAHSENSTTDDVAEKLQLDTGLLANVFKIVNSAGYGFRKRVDSLKLAVTLLGLEELANIVMAAQVYDKLGDYEDGAGLDPKAFWRHAVGVGFASRALSKKLNVEAESAFLAGMLHDVGKIVLDRYFGDFYKACLKRVADGTTSIYTAEQDVMGVTHAEIGGVLAGEWKFANNYTNTTMYHHTPKDAVRYKRLVCLVHIADAMTRQLGFGSGGDSTVPDVDEAALDQFSMQSRGLQLLVQAVQEELEGADSFLAAMGG